MAYRQLLALACVTFGLSATACGGGNANGAPGPLGEVEDSPGRSADQPPGNGDQPPASADRPPINGDRAPGGPAGGGDDDGGGDGGGEDATEAQCRAFCAGLDLENCSGGGANAAARAVCNTNCELKPEEKPCASQASSLITCLSSLDGLCIDDGPSGAAAARCQSALEAMSECVEDNTPTETPGPGGDCSDGDACTQCVCNAGTDINELQACTAACIDP